MPGIPEEVDTERLRETAAALENIVQMQREKVDKWAQTGEVPPTGPPEVESFFKVIMMFFEEKGLTSRVNELWNSTPVNEEEEEARQYAGRILESVLRSQGVVAEAYNTRRRLLKDIPEEMPALMREVERELERTRKGTRQIV